MTIVEETQATAGPVGALARVSALEMLRDYCLSSPKAALKVDALLYR